MAGLTVCLFLCLVLSAQGQYHIVRNSMYHGHFFEAKFHFKKYGSRDWRSAYFALMSSTIETGLSGSEKAKDKYDDFLKEFEDHLDTLRCKPSEKVFLEAEYHLQQSIIKARFGQELDALFSFRNAYNLVEKGREEYPDFEPLLKTQGTLSLLLGSVPDDYQWILSLLGWKGSIEQGLNQYEKIFDSHLWGPEAKMLTFLSQSYLMDEQRKAADSMKELFNDHQDEMLFRYVYMTLLAKSAQAAKVIELSDFLDPTLIVQNYFMVGEAYLQNGDYPKAIQHLNFFLEYYEGTDLVKDAYFKIYLSYLLNGEEVKADSVRQLAQSRGNSRLESDKYAAYNLGSEDTNINIWKARLAFDGGFYDKAQANLDAFNRSASKSTKLKCEATYRQARIYHKTGRVDKAKSQYEKAIDMTGDNPWYYGANSALQLGMMAYKTGRTEEAVEWFELAREFDDHEYEKSIRRKAKTMINLIQHSQK